MRDVLIHLYDEVDMKLACISDEMDEVIKDIAFKLPNKEYYQLVLVYPDGTIRKVIING